MKPRVYIFGILCVMILSAVVLSKKSAHSFNMEREPGYEYPIITKPYTPKPFKPRQYVIYRTVDPITIDGKMDETSWRNAEWTNKFGHIVYTGYKTPFLDSRAKMLWDDENIYFFIDMEEPNLIGHLVKNDTLICIDNDIEIFFDVDSDAQDYIELEFNCLGTILDLFYHKELHRGPLPYGWLENPYSPPWDLEGLLVAVRLDGSVNYPFDTDRGWTVEVLVPWESLQKTSRTGEILNRNGSFFRVTFERVVYPWPKDVWPIMNWSDRGGSCWDWTWSPELTYHLHCCETFGRVILSERTVLQTKDMELENSFPFIEPPRMRRKPKVGSMVKIKGGTYTIGPDFTDPKCSPKGEVTVKDFYIDRYEVTIGEFVKFLNAGGNDKYYEVDMGDPDMCGITKIKDGEYKVVPGKEYYPMVQMTVEAARAYAASAGKRLPTEYEWEIAARGKEARTYPWGNEPYDIDRANFNYHVGYTTPVGSYEKGKTPESIYDMAGNVWELIDEIWNEYPWGTKKEGREAGTTIIRGGSWVTSGGNLKSTYRNALKSHYRGPFIGFRCVRDAH